MAEKLYPPLIAGSLPAFYKNYDSSTNVVLTSYITIPFTESAVVGAGDFAGFMLRLKTASTGTYLFDPVYSANYDSENSSVTFTLSAADAALLNEGLFYKVQLAYVSAETKTTINSDGTTETTVSRLTGYYSTIGVIKCVPKPNVYIRDYSIDSINLFNNEMFGVYSVDSDLDRTEKVYSYNFTFYTDDNEEYYTTGEILHNTSEDSDYGESIDRAVFSSFIDNGEIYKLVYTVTTVNGLVISSPYYRITAESLLAPSKDLYVLPEPNEDTGSITVKLKGLDKIVKKENTIQSLKHTERVPDRDKELFLNLLYFYWGSTKKPAVPKVEKFVNQITDPNATNIAIFLNNYRAYLKDNINLCSELLTISTGLLESLIDGSTTFCTDLGTFVGSIVDAPESALNTYKTFITEKLTSYILTTSSGYLNLVASMQVRVDEYNNYLVDLSRSDETEYGSYNTNQTLLTTALTIITTCDLDIEIGVEYLSLLDYTAVIELSEETKEETYFGQYILARSSEEDGYTTWIEMKRFRLENIQPSNITYNDWTVKQGIKYIYSIQQYNIWGLYSSRIVSEPVSIDLEDIFLYDGERSLRVQYNPKVSSFKTTLLEAKTNTIGSKYPYIFRNGKVEYKEFPLSGLISFLMDNERLFYNKEIEEEYYYRLCTENRYRKNSDEFMAEMNEVLFNPTDLVELNIRRERDFKLDVLDWLNNGKPKLFRSGPEGNYIVHIMNVSLSPTDALGRMLHTFTSSCVEIADFTYENLLKYGFVQTDTVSKYVSLWKTFYLNEYPKGIDIEITFDSNVSYFSVSDLLPGTNIYITYADTLVKEEEAITIGITGSYTFSDSSRLVLKIRFPNSEWHLVGILEVLYKGVRYSDFDAITSMKLKTILSNQYIGVNPDLTYLDTLAVEDGDKFKKTIKALNYRTLLNVTDSPKQILAQMLADGFEPGDILLYINTNFYNYTKNKIRISNLEHLRFRVRELIPVYAVPYDLIGPEGWERMPLSVYYTSGTSAYWKQLDGTYLRELYTAPEFPAQNLLYSVTPFGTPYPIDELSPIIRDYYDINDEFCVFQLMEYNEKFGVWMPSERHNYLGVRTGKYYDCYWKNVIDDYDTCFYLDEKYRYDLLDFTETEILTDENGRYYLEVGQIKKYFGEFGDELGVEELPLYVKHNGEYVLAKDLYIFPQDDLGFYTSLFNNDERITEKEYLNEAIRWKDKEDYHSIDDYYNNSWSPDENKRAASVVRSAEVGPFYLREESLILLLPGEVREYRNLTNPTVIRSGSGLIVEATFLLEILDYFTEDNVGTVAIAKSKYLSLSEFLQTLYRDYEILAEADNNFQRYLTLSRIYRTLIEGLSADDNIPLEDTNDYTSIESALINYQDRRIIQEILNTTKGNQDKTLIEELADLWSRNNLTVEERNAVEESVEALIKRLGFNKYTREELDLIETEEEDLLDLITSNYKDGLAAKQTQIGEVLKTLAAQSAAAQTDIDTAVEDYQTKLNALKNSLTDCNVSIYSFHAKMWLYILILHYLRAKFSIDPDKPWEGFQDETALAEIDRSINAKGILTMIKEHYNNVLAVLGDASGTISDEASSYRTWYQEAWGQAQSLKNAISVNQSIISEKEGDSSLDDFLTSEIQAQMLELFYYYYKAYVCRRSINRILNTLPEDSNTKEFKDYVEHTTYISGERVTMYDFEDLTTLLVSLKDSLVNKENPEVTFEDANYDYFIAYMDSTVKTTYNSFIQLLNARNNELTNEDSEQIIEFIKIFDRYSYAKMGINIVEACSNGSVKVNWDCVVDDSFGKSTSQELFSETIETTEQAKDLEARYKYVVNKVISTYMSKMDSSELSKVLSQSNRDIIYEYGEAVIIASELDIFNSKEFDGSTSTSALKAARIAKINALLSKIDEYLGTIGENEDSNNYYYLLAELSNVSSESGGLINSLANVNTLIKELNTLLLNYQKLIWAKTRFDTYVKVTCESTDHLGYLAGKYCVYNANKNEYIPIDPETHEFDTEHNTYYIQLRDMMIYDFLTYYDSLIIEDEEKLAITAEDVNDYLVSDGTMISFNTFKLLKRFAEYGGIGDIEISTNSQSEDFFYNKMITNIIGFTAEPSSVESALSNGTTVTKLVSTVSDTSATSLYLAPFVDNIQKYIEAVLLEPSSEELAYYLTCITEASAATSAASKYDIFRWVSWLGDLYYCYNAGICDRIEISHFKQEMATKMRSGESDIISNDLAKEEYGQLTKVGIVYWYLYTVLNTSVNDLSDLIEQANTLANLYDNKYENYTAKQELYFNNYKEYLAVYMGYLGSDVFNYYNSSMDDKDTYMNNLIASIKDAWYDFIIALDKGYKQEIEAGMYQ